MKKYKIIVATLSIIIILSSALFLIINLNGSEEKNIKEKVKEIKQYEEIAETVTTDNEKNYNIIEMYQNKFNNKDIIGELYIPNTSIKVPIAQASNNEYYLNHLLSKEKNSLGSTFLDYRNKTTDRKLIIYGHNSQNVYTEFHTLEKYIDSSYYNEHSDIYLQTMDTTYHYKIFSVYIATTNFNHVNLNFSNEEYTRHIYWLKEQSLYNININVSGYDDILILQTCYFNPENSYLIIAAKKI